MLGLRALQGSVLSVFVFLVVACGNESPRDTGVERVARSALEPVQSVAWSQQPPAELFPEEIPQFVAITYDDNFVPSGMHWAAEYYKSLTNPSGNGTVGTFDGTPVLTSFYHTSIYIDGGEANLTAWREAFKLGHEAADHTRNHSPGTHFSVEQWLKEIADCKEALTHPEWGIGAQASDVIGFRSPYLAYNEHTFSALAKEGFRYDTSIQNCWADDENGKNCSFPYTLDEGSGDADVLNRKFEAPKISRYAGIWEVPLSALVVPDDALASEYDFDRGLRTRIPSGMPMPSYFEATSGKIAPLDITLFVDAKLSSREVLAILKYNLDLHRAGNRSPLVFVAHTHVYADDYLVTDKAPTAAERREAIAKFTEYALTKPEVRVRPVRDIVSWMQNPVPLTGKRTVDAGARDAATEAGNSAGGADTSDGTSGSNSSVPSSSALDAGTSTSKRRPRNAATTSSCGVAHPVDGGTSAGLLVAISALVIRFRRSKRRSK